MSVVVSGTLKSPDGQVVSDANITLTALTVSPDALSGTSASAVTTSTGYYGMTMEPGEYAVSVTVRGKTAVYGRVRIEGTESTVTLNMLLRRSLVEVSIPGELLTDFRQIQNNVADDLATIRRLNEDTAVKNNQASQSKESAAASAKTASESAKAATSKATESAQKASEAAEAATRAGESEKAAAADAKEARQHAETARVAQEAAGDVLKRAEAATVSAEEARRMAENARGPKGDTGPKGDAGPRGETGPAVRVGRKVSRESADLRAYRARKVIQENGDLREYRGQLAQQGHLAHVVRPGHREQWGRVVKPGPEAKKETRGGLRDQRGILVREVSRGRQEQRESAVRPDLRGRKGNPGNVVRKDYRAPPEREVNRVRQVRKVNEAKPDLRDLVGSQARRAAQQMWQMRRRHRRELCS